MVDGGVLLNSIINAIVAAVCAISGTAAADIRQLAQPAGKAIIDQIAAIISGRALEPLQEVWHHLLEFLKAAGQFTFLNENIIAANFKIQLSELLHWAPVELMTINRQMSNNDVLRQMDEQGFRAATLFELLRWWLLNPAKWSSCLVVALGSVWQGDVPYVNGGGSDRDLDLVSVGDGWNPRCVFAVVRK